VPVVAQLGQWGLRHRPATRRLRARAELLPDQNGPTVMERLAEAYAAAL